LRGLAPQTAQARGPGDEDLVHKAKEKAMPKNSCSTAEFPGQGLSIRNRPKVAVKNIIPLIGKKRGPVRVEPKLNLRSQTLEELNLGPPAERKDLHGNRGLGP